MSKRNYLITAIIIIVAFFFILFGGSKKEQAVSTSHPAVMVNLDSVNNSGISGTATLIDVNGKASVIIKLENPPLGNEEPIDISGGNCSALGVPKFTLNPAKSGSSETNLDLSLAEIMKLTPLAINIHKSNDEAGIYVACGNLIVAAPENTTGSESQPAVNQ